ncbi:leucine zipper putative tumor suppressor 2-like protein [Elysia marginata]|uniref:Leucine zipper putative tumor suppressor 2-like protein n=1 Tax=Elysia marginata TaxID=1093978 RepID=A0AAV4I1N6_9GAST|nr:leucine zipper putative tumor suppressor 2-like protein [Elysia marginata]
MHEDPSSGCSVLGVHLGQHLITAAMGMVLRVEVHSASPSGKPGPGVKCGGDQSADNRPDRYRPVALHARPGTLNLSKNGWESVSVFSRVQCQVVTPVELQKPGPNLIKPIACKPGRSGSPTSSRTPSGNTPHRGSSESDGKSSGPQYPRTHPLQPPLSSRLQAIKQGISADPLSPDEVGNSNNLLGGLGAFGKLADSSFQNETRLTSFVGPPGPSSSNALNTSPPQSSQPLPSSITAVQQTGSTSIYKNITPVVTTSQQNQQHQSPGDPNTSYSSFTGEFPHSDTVCASQNFASNTAPVPPSHQPYHSQHQQQRIAGETNVLQTPSPSDSGVGEHEAILREKDAEINTLREVMDRNERAIFQVYEERRHVWLNDTRKLQDEYERKLKVQSRKSYKTEQVLSLQVYKLQQEQKSLQEDKVKVTQELDALRQRLEEEQTEVCNLKKQLGLASPSSKVATPSLPLDSKDTVSEKNDADAALTPLTSTGNNSPTQAEKQQGGQTVNNNESPQSLQREIVLKNKELIQLRNQLAGYEADLGKANRELNEKAREIVNCNDKIKSLQEELNRAKNPPQLAETGSQTHAAASEVVSNENLQRPSLLGKQERTIDELQEETLNLRAHIEELKAQQEEERKQWLDEKNKVVRYQKQLQLNYVQMQRKNTALETEVQQLTLELENRDMKLTALSGEESVC